MAFVGGLPQGAASLGVLGSQNAGLLGLKVRRAAGRGLSVQGSGSGA